MGAAEITPSVDDDGTSYAVISGDDGSLVDITGAGRKRINGDLYSRDNGTMDLAMDTSDSALTGLSKIVNGTTNIEMSNVRSGT